MELALEELIERLKNTAFDISEFTIDTDGNWYKNEKLSLKDTENIVEILDQYAEIQDCVKWYLHNTEHDVFKTPEEVQAHSDKCRHHKLLLATQILNITGRNNNG